MDLSFSKKQRTSSRQLRFSQNSRVIHNRTPSEMPSAVRFLYLNIRHKTYATPPSNKVISHASSNSQNLGPGKYNIPSLCPSQSFEFSKAPRFEQEKVLDILNRQASRKKLQFSRQIEINKLISFETPETKRAKSRESARSHKIRAEVVKITRENIMQSNKITKENALKEKYIKIEYVKRKDEIKEIKKSWIALNFFIGSVFILKTFIRKRKALRKKISKNYKILQQATKCIGRIIILAKRIRQRKATSVRCI